LARETTVGNRAEILQHLEAHVELPAAAVDEHEIGQHAAFLQRAGKAPAQHLLERREVVGGGTVLMRKRL